MKIKKHFFTLLLLSVFLVFGTGCAVIVPGHRSHTPHYSSKNKMPPGQMKKLTGAKSAKQYAPGQNKKNKKNK